MTPLIRGAFHLQRQLKLLFKQIRRFGSVACRLERKFKAERVDGENNEQWALEPFSYTVPHYENAEQFA